MLHIAHKPKRILLVDDDYSTRAITQALVAALGHEVETASDGIEGLPRSVSGSIWCCSTSSCRVSTALRCAVAFAPTR
jgi:DNA-binding NtrC family response regulator